MVILAQIELIAIAPLLIHRLPELIVIGGAAVLCRRLMINGVTFALPYRDTVVVKALIELIAIAPQLIHRLPALTVRGGAAVLSRRLMINGVIFAEGH